MKNTKLILIAFILTFKIYAQNIEVGLLYNVNQETELRKEASFNSPKIINDKASGELRGTVYKSISPEESIVEVKAVENDWAQISVIEPDWLRDSHKGWVPISVLYSKTMKGYIKRTCYTYTSNNLGAKAIGVLKKSQSVLAIKNKKGLLLLLEIPVGKQTKEKCYIKIDDFTLTYPG